MKNMISVATKKAAADLIIKNINIVNTFSNVIVKGDVAVSGDRIAGISSGYIEDDMTIIIDGTDKYLTSGLIDAHIHFESSMTTPENYIKEVVCSGTLTLINDPHEIANVCGIDGIDYVIKNTRRCDANVFFAVPSCVPSSVEELNGATLDAKDLKVFLEDKYKGKVVALAEMMDFKAVLNGEFPVTDKLNLFKDMPIDGHFISDNVDNINGYYSTGINTNHEIVDFKSALMHINAGCYIAVREGSAAKNLEAIIRGAVAESDKNPYIYNKMMFCTDDKHIEDLRKEGSVVHNIRMAVKLGVPPIEAIKMATINTAQCYNLKGHGAVLPGYKADLVIFDNLEDFNVEKVIFDGYIVGEQEIWEDIEKLYEKQQNDLIKNITNTINIDEVTKSDISLRINTDVTDVIGIIKGEILTAIKTCKVPVQNGFFTPNEEFAKIVCIERHSFSGEIGVGVVKGFNIKNGAVATSVGHDSHNLLAVGDNDDDILIAVESIKAMNGGVVIVKDGNVIASICLDIAGLMSSKGNEYVVDSIKSLKNATIEIGVDEDMELLITLSFLSLTAIPEIRITPTGVVQLEI